MARYVAVTPLVVAKDESERDVYVYAGQPVPENVNERSLARLLDEGFIAVIEEPADEQPEADFPDGDPSDSWKIDQLKAYAAAKSIDLGSASKKDEILAIIALTSA